MPDRQIESTMTPPCCGVDEAGRGPLAGPVVAAAVIVPAAAEEHLPGLDDSKKLTSLARERLFDRITRFCRVGIGMASVTEIDTINILQATFLAMERSVEALNQTPGPPVASALVDGNRLPQLPCPAMAVIGGDRRCTSIAAASVIAKVTRDRIMIDLGRTFPGYGWDRNKGYGTAEHRNAIKALGITPHHRTSFAPISQRS